MQKINRSEIEKMLLDFEVIDTKVEQDNKELIIQTTLSNRDRFLVKYNVKTRNKTYYLN